MQRPIALGLSLGLLFSCAPASPEDEVTKGGAAAVSEESGMPEEEPVLQDREIVSRRIATPKQGAGETLDEVEEVTESAFDSNAWNTTVGLGGGAGGKFGGRRAVPGTEDYERIEEHGFRPAIDHPLSTFAVDVDGASWSNIRRFLHDGRLPPADAVRVEECINWFRYDDPGPGADAEHPIAVHTETGPCPWAPDHRLLRVVLRTADIEIDELAPRNLVFLVDVSGSMRSPRKLPLLKRGLRLLTRQMRPRDRIAIVTYAGSSRVALQPTEGSKRTAIEAAIEGLSSGGSTNGSGGIEAAYDLARAHAGAESIDRVILATDGDFNVGVSDRAQLVKLIERHRDDGIFLSVLGFGTGNLKDANLEALGRHGNGHYAYIDSIAEARRVLVEQAGATLVTVAKDVKVQIEFNPRFVQSYRQVGYENRKLAARDFNDDRKDAGEMGAGHCVTALYELVPVGVEPPPPPVDSLRYRAAAAPAAAPADKLAETAPARRELLTVKVRYKHPDADASRRLEIFALEDLAAQPSQDFRFATAVAAFGMLLRDSEHVGAIGTGDIMMLARGARGADLGGERAEFIKLVQMAADLASTAQGTR